MLTLGIRYLTGYSVAAQFSNRDAAEWPPHPARVQMALAAACFETEEQREEVAALQWLEEQEPPELAVAEATARDVTTSYVPVNDKAGPALGDLQSCPGFTRNKQSRTYPKVWLQPANDGEAYLFLTWPKAEPTQEILTGLEYLTAKVTRIGHSSSLTQMFVAEQSPPSTHIPTEFGRWNLRVCSPGLFGYLKASYSQEQVDDYYSLLDRIQAAKGKEKKTLREELANRFGDRIPAPSRPVINRWQAYDSPRETTPDVPSGDFAPTLTVLSILEGPVLAAESAWRFLTAVRDTILSNCEPIPEWISGHAEDGSPAASKHLALLPLAYVGSRHADGHLMGVGLAFPHEIAIAQQGRTLGPMLFDQHGAAKTIQIKCGKFGEWKLMRETRDSPPLTLQTESWTEPNRRWATMSPLVLDRFPKTDRAKNEFRWREEVAEMIVTSCQRQGLPSPVYIEVGANSRHRGVPRAIPGKTGYPFRPTKAGQSPRPQVHAYLEFAEPIAGPLLLGAGRYRGYGVCKPICSNRKNRTERKGGYGQQ